MTAPDRIWVQWPHVNGAGLAFTCQARPPALRHEYIRADLATPAAMTPEMEALVSREAATAREVFEDYGSKAKEAIDYMEQLLLAALREGVIHKNSQ